MSPHSLRVTLALITLLTIGLSSGSRAQAQAPRRLALVGGMLLDGYEAPPINHAAECAARFEDATNEQTARPYHHVRL